MHGLAFPYAVQDSRELFDRDEALKTIRDTLGLAAPTVVVILGGRLVGKTSLLNVVAQWAEQQASFSVVRLAHAATRDEIAAEIVDGIHQKVDPSGSTADLVDRHGRFALSTGTGLVRILQELARRALETRFLLCIDEFDSLLEGCDDAEARQILELVPLLTENPELPVRLLFTMSRIPDRVRRSYRSPFLNQAKFVELMPWAAPDSREFAERLLDGRLKLDEQAQDMLFAAAGGHPYFTKAVLHALLDADQRGAGDDHRPTAVAMAGAVQAATRSREVDVALSNIADVHLPPEGITLLDRAASNPAGLSRRDLRDLAPADEALRALTDSGFLSEADGRYSLRLGLWKPWRGGRLGDGADLSGPIGRLDQVLRRLVAGRVAKAALLSALAAMVLTVALGTVLFLSSQSLTAEACAGTGLRARVSYPSYVSSGDEQQLQVQVANDGTGSLPVAGSAVVNFPPGRSRRVDVTSDNAISFERLGPGEQQTLVVAFTYVQPERLLPGSGSRVPVELRMSAAGTLCPAERWSMAVAPVPHLRGLRNAIFGLIGLVGIPLLLEWLIARHSRRRAAHRVEREHTPEPGPAARRR